MLKLAKKFWNDEQGLEFSEYALMLVLICLLVIGAVTLLKDQIVAAFTRASEEMAPATSGG